MTTATNAPQPESRPEGSSEKNARAMRANPPSAFRSLAWGAAPSPDLRRYAGASGGLTLYAPNTPARPVDLFGVPVTSELYHFAFGRFYLGQAFLDGRENFLAMKSALTTAYGKPSLRNDLAQVYAWQWDDAEVEVRLYYQATYDKSTVEFRSGRF